MKIDVTKDKIKTATKKLMAKCENPAQVTSRTIAQEAGVQLAMINYCFGSREGLLFTLFEEMSESHFRECPQIYGVLQSDIQPKEKLRQLHYLIAGMLLNNFSYTQAVTGYVLLHRDLSLGLNSLPLVIAHYNGRKTMQECQLISYELSSIMQLAVNRHEALHEFCGIDLTDSEQLKKYVDMQIDIFLQN